VRIRSVFSHSAQAIAEGALISLLVVGLMAGTAFAGKGGSGKPIGGGTPAGSCSVNPDPVAVGADYTLTGTGLGAGAIVNVMISDSGVVSSWNLQADASGTSTLVWHSYWTGTSKVTYQKSSGHHGSTVVASCSFTVN
jgi:hypothetical protein